MEALLLLYNLPCFAVVAAAAAAALWAIARREFGARGKIGECLLVSPSAAAADQSTGMEKGMRRWLLGVRVAAAAAMAGTLAWDVRTYGWSIMFYYTEWTFTLVIVYFLIATFVSARGCWSYSKHLTADVENRGLLKRDVEENIDSTVNPETNSNGKAIRFGSSYRQGEIEQKAEILENIMQITYQTSAGAVVLTDIVFWGLLVPFLSVEHFSLDLLMGCMHSVNAVFLLLDTALNSMPFPWFRISYFVLWSCIYVAFQWVLHACGFSWWPYPFLELSTPWAPLWYLSLALIHIPCYGLYAVIVKAKVSFLSKFFPQAYIRPC